MFSHALRRGCKVKMTEQANEGQVYTLHNPSLLPKCNLSHAGMFRAESQTTHKHRTSDVKS